MTLLEQYQQKETPFYAYHMNVLKDTLQAVKEESDKYDFHIHYALKANADAKILETIRSYGFGADCVSGNEILCALENGFDGSQIAFAGVGKTDAEIKIGLDNDIFTFNCESIPEILVINEIAESENKIANIAIRINPNVNANTHHYITTGLEENKFGISFWEFDTLLRVLETCDHIRLLGLHFHIGSQIRDLSVFKSLCRKVNEVQDWFADRKIFFDHINVGGGLGVEYEHPEEKMIPDFQSYFQVFDQFLNLHPNQTLHFELGRALVAQCGELITKVLYVKEGIKTNFAIVDAGMTELLRPALYQASHKIVNLSANGSEEVKKYDVVGPICESSDCFAKSITLPETKRGDLLALKTAGAYGEVMASQYNLRDIVKAYHF